MMIRVYPENPAPRHIDMAVEVLRKGGLVIYPTDTVYAIGCDMNNSKAIDQLCLLLGKKTEQTNLALICYDLSDISEYTVPFTNPVYKLMKRSLPGPYTFILKANSKVPKLFKNKKREIGIRVPDNNIPRELAKALGNPLMTASLKDANNGNDYYTDPQEIKDKFEKRVDLIIDGGVGDYVASSVIDCTGDEPELVREGRDPAEVL